jgi:paraquat-inducible protein A
MSFACPNCSTTIHPGADLRGQQALRCPDCKVMIQLTDGTVVRSGISQGGKPDMAKERRQTSGTASLKSLFPDKARIMSAGLFAATLAYVLGIFWPLMTIEKSIFGIKFSGETVSLVSGLAALCAKGDVFLFLIVFFFSIAFPVGKLIVLFRLWNHPYTADRCEELAHRLAVFGKWSMLDVMVVGLLVVIVKIRGMVAVNVHAGVYLFAMSVILTMLLTASIGTMLATRSVR